MYTIQNNIFLIPARGGSKGIPQKNVRLLGGQPLILYVLKTLKNLTEKKRIIVSTDDDLIADIARPFALIHRRSEENASDKSTLDDVAREVVKWIEKEKLIDSFENLITIQPTSPFIRIDSIKEMLKLLSENEIDSVISVKDDRHLRWTITDGEAKPLYRERVNRQWLGPVFSETGGMVGCKVSSLKKFKSRIGNKTELVILDEKEGLDIDSFSDWAIAEYWLNKLNVLIRVDGSKQLGFGHLYRSVALSQCLMKHNVTLVTRCDKEYQIGYSFLKKSNYRILCIKNEKEFFGVIERENPDIIINDILDTKESYIKKIKGRDIFVVNFEDLGNGNKYADIVINDLYPDLYPRDNHWYGLKYAILNPQFELVKPKKDIDVDIKNILVAFGGTDPGNLTVKVLLALKQLGFMGDITVVLGPGYNHHEELGITLENWQENKQQIRILHDVKNMAELMKSCNMAITSAGRTVTELMVIGIPTIAICQNIREMRHDHATSAYGVVNIGLGKSIGTKSLADHIKIYIDTPTLRRDMFLRMRKAIIDRSNKNVVEEIIKNYWKVRNMNGNKN